MKGYKGFDKNMACRGMQYEVGKTYESPTADLCKSGLHWCENPLDCLRYYAPGESQYAETEAGGAISPPESGGDSKRCSTELTVKASLSFGDLVRAGVEYAKKSAAATSGNYAHAATSGGYANAATSGEYAHAATSGDCANAATSGYRAHAATSGGYANAATSGANAIAAAIGLGGKAKAALGSWIVAAEYDNNGAPVCVLAAKVDGEAIKADTWYMVRGGKWEACNA